jgi:predicted transcriptional regulator of viral defense system
MEQPIVARRARISFIAGEQAGYFTAKQAMSAGYSYADQHYQTGSGNWSRIDRGIYRLANYPTFPLRDDLIVMSLLSADRSGEPQAVVSHESALAAHGMSDANPARIHLTVPSRYRKQMPPGVVLHKASLSSTDWEQREGYRVTTPLRTILDTAATPTSWPYLTDAVYDALRKGLVRASQLAVTANKESNEEVQKWLLSALEVAEQRIARMVGR